MILMPFHFLSSACHLVISERLTDVANYIMAAPLRRLTFIYYLADDNYAHFTLLRRFHSGHRDKHSAMFLRAALINITPTLARRRFLEFQLLYDLFPRVLTLTLMRRRLMLFVYSPITYNYCLMARTLGDLRRVSRCCFS